MYEKLRDIESPRRRQREVARKQALENVAEVRVFHSHLAHNCYEFRQYVFAWRITGVQRSISSIGFETTGYCHQVDRECGRTQSRTFGRVFAVTYCVCRCNFVPSKHDK